MRYLKFNSAQCAIPELIFLMREPARYALSPANQFQTAVHGGISLYRASNSVKSDTVKKRQRLRIIRRQVPVVLPVRQWREMSTKKDADSKPQRSYLILAVRSSQQARGISQFTSRWYLCARKSPYALHPDSQKFLQCCLMVSVAPCVLTSHPTRERSHYSARLSLVGW